MGSLDVVDHPWPLVAREREDMVIARGSKEGSPVLRCSVGGQGRLVKGYP